jgi:hypothetical protein
MQKNFGFYVRRNRIDSELRRCVKAGSAGFYVSPKPKLQVLYILFRRKRKGNLIWSAEL